MPNPSGTASVDPRSRADRPTWVDLLNPTQDEAAEVAAEYRVQVPSRESLQEVESSSRARAEGQVLYVNMPLVIQDASAGFAPLPLGFILSPELLVTVRYSDVHAFAKVKAQVGKDPHMSSAAVFVALIDGMVDFAADMLETSGNSLAALSASTFGQNAAPVVRHKRMTHALRESLTTVGSAGDQLSRIRESLLGLQRIVSFVSEMADEWLLPELQTHLKTAQQDLTSLVDFEAHLSERPVPAGRNSWSYQYRAERNLQSAHDRVGSRDSSHIDRQHVRHEFPQHAGVGMALGLFVRIGAHRVEYIAANPLVQATRVVVKQGRFEYVQCGIAAIRYAIVTAVS